MEKWSPFMKVVYTLECKYSGMSQSHQWCIMCSGDDRAAKSAFISVWKKTSEQQTNQQIKNKKRKTNK